MDIAAMNVRITFQKNLVQADEIGNRTNTWTDYHTCFATMSDSSGSNAEKSIAGLVVDTSEVTFSVRYCKALMSVNSTNYRILWNGELYNIVKTDHLNMKKHALKFKCEKVRC